MQRFHSIPFLLVAGALLFLAGPSSCGGKGEVTYSGTIQPIFNSNCAFSGCHDSFTSAAGMSLEADESYDNIVGVPSTQTALNRIEPGVPEESYLYLKVTGDYLDVPGGENTGQMPLNGTPLSDRDLMDIEQWILDGAPNN